MKKEKEKGKKKRYRDIERNAYHFAKESVWGRGRFIFQIYKALVHNLRNNYVNAWEFHLINTAQCCICLLQKKEQ